jgi:hypothetical protein
MMTAPHYRIDEGEFNALTAWLSGIDSAVDRLTAKQPQPDDLATIRRFSASAFKLLCEIRERAAH